jgi:hypothetical protein
MPGTVTLSHQGVWAGSRPSLTVAIKGKGEVEAWYLVGRRADRGAAAVGGARSDPAS